MPTLTASLPLSLAILASAGVTVAAHLLRPARPWLIYLFKPLTTLLIFILALLPRPPFPDPYATPIALGLLFSLAGDIFLMLPGSYFIHGLASFLLAHLAYILAFLPGALGLSTLWPLMPLLLFGGLILRRLWPGLSKPLQTPVVLYVLVILGMTTLALSRAIQAPSHATLSASVGATLFLTSDTLLALDRFHKPLPRAPVVILSTYFAGQFLIALSVALSG